MSWVVVFAKQAAKDASKLAAAGLKPKAQALLDVLGQDPFRNPPPFEKLVGEWSNLTTGRRTLYELAGDGLAR